MTRLFFAVPTPDLVTMSIETAQQRLRSLAGTSGISWESPAKFHFTVKFLGESSDLQLAAVRNAGREVSELMSPFTVVIGGIGAFPRSSHPANAWVGASGDIPDFGRLAELIDIHLAFRGFPREKRPFHPHVTIARVKSAAGSEALAGAIQEIAVREKNVDTIGVFVVQSVTLMRSELRPSGSVYSVIEEFPFTGQ